MWDETDDDWADKDWAESDEESPTVSCPECGSDVYEESEHCPACGHFLLPDSSHPLMEKPAWFVILGLVGILATLIALAAMP